MRQSLLICASLAVFVLPCQADDTPVAAETLIRLTVYPAPAAKPALRYLLLPELRELEPGNPCHIYLKCFMESQKFFFDKEAFQRREKLLVMPLKELPAQELLDYGHLHLQYADLAARLDRPDWQILSKLKTDGIGLLVPDLQEMRKLASALKVRFRAEVALGRFDDALRTAKTMFAMSRHLYEHPTLIADLVGIAVAFVAIGPLEEMLEQPGCPNLYWALTNLPIPLIPLDKGMEGDRAGLAGEFRDLDESAPMTVEQLKKFITRMDQMLADGKPVKPSDSMQLFLDARNKDESKVGAARRRLIETGYPADRVQRFPADQVILLDEKLEFEVRRDELMKLTTLPSWQITAMGGLVYKKTKEQALFADLFVPALHRVHRTAGRLDQRIAMLRHIEALRMYAAEHNTLPRKLSEVTVPLPDDPFTGKPFHYELRGETAHLRGSPPQGEEKNAMFNIHFEVILRK